MAKKVRKAADQRRSAMVSGTGLSMHTKSQRAAKVQRTDLDAPSHYSVAGVVNASVVSAVDANFDGQISIADLGVLDAN